jgi:hypothetical protein
MVGAMVLDVPSAIWHHKFRMNKLLIEPMVDGNLSPNEPFIIAGVWFHWKDMTPEQKKKVIVRKIAIADSCKKEDEESFWIGIAEDFGRT